MIGGGALRGRIGRRAFARGAAASFLLPWREPPARAQSPGRVKRLLLFCTMGTRPKIWAPPLVAAENDFTFSACTEPLAAIKEHLVMVDGLPTGNPSNQHGSPDALSGLGYSALETPALISVDQFISDRLRGAGINRPIGALLLGAGTSDNGGLTMFNRVKNLSTIASPATAFSTVFGPRGGNAGPPPEVLLRRRKSVIDLVRRELGDLGARVGAEERARLERHLDSIRELENRLLQPASMPGPSCLPPALPAEGGLSSLQQNLLHLDVIVGAFACDVTRVAAIEFGSDQSMAVDLPALGLQGDQHGQFIHGGAPTGYKEMIGLERWLAQRFVEVVQKLKALPEPDGSGTLLDGTLVAWCRDMGDAHLHNQQSMRFVLAGGRNRYLRTDPRGRYLFARGDGPAIRHERVLLNLCEAMGITDFRGFGDPSLDAEHKTPLPGVAVS